MQQIMEWLAPVNDYSGVIIILVVFLLIYLLIVVKSGQQSLETVSRELVGRMDGVEDELHHHIDRDTQVLRGALNTVRERVVAAAEVWDRDSQELKESVVSEMKSEKGQFEKTVDQVRTLLEEQGVYLHDKLENLADDESKTHYLRDAVMVGVTEEMRQTRQEIQESLKHSAQLASESMTRLTAEVDAKLELISGKVDTKLLELTEKVKKDFAAEMDETMRTFTTLREQVDALISSNRDVHEVGRDVTALSRMIFAKTTAGQQSDLAELLAHFLPEGSYGLNVSLGGATADAALRLPGVEGEVVIDSGMPLQGIDALLAEDAGEGRTALRAQFDETLTHYIRQVAQQFISPPTTADRAILFISSEAAFAEIQAYHQQALATAAEMRVWVVSPTMLSAVLNVARNAIKDHQANEQLQSLRQALNDVARESQQFESRLLEIGDHVNNALRSVQRAETAGMRLFGKVNAAVGGGETRPLPRSSDTVE